MYHDVCGTLNGRRLKDGSLLYGCTCNLSMTPSSVRRLEFDTGFPDAAFEARSALVPVSCKPCSGLARLCQLLTGGERAGACNRLCVVTTC